MEQADYIPLRDLAGLLRALHVISVDAYMDIVCMETWSPTLAGEL